MAKDPELHYKSRFPPTLVILRLGGRVMAYGFRPVFRANLYVVWFVSDCVMIKDRFHGVLGLSESEHCVSGHKNPEHNGKRGCAQISANGGAQISANGGVPKFLQT